jgi:hypothetical protein
VLADLAELYAAGSNPTGGSVNYRIPALLSVTAVLASMFVSCGSDNGNDKDFVKGLCEASSELRTGVEQAVKTGATSTDPGKSVELLVGPVDAFVKAFGDLKPPKDLKSWHKDATAQLEKTAETFRNEKKLTALATFNDSPVPDPPADAKARLQNVAKDVPECNGVAFFKP